MKSATFPVTVLGCILGVTIALAQEGFGPDPGKPGNRAEFNDTNLHPRSPRPTGFDRDERGVPQDHPDFDGRQSHDRFRPNGEARWHNNLPPPPPPFPPPSPNVSGQDFNRMVPRFHFPGGANQHGRQFAGPPPGFPPPPPFGAAGRPPKLRHRGPHGERFAPAPYRYGHPSGEAGLLGILDSNRDGRLSADEIANAANALNALDMDDDGALTAEELTSHGKPLPPRTDITEKQRTGSKTGNRKSRRKRSSSP